MSISVSITEYLQWGGSGLSKLVLCVRIANRLPPELAGISSFPTTT